MRVLRTTVFNRTLVPRTVDTGRSIKENINEGESCKFEILKRAWSIYDKRLIGKQPEILIADRGYKGQKEFGKTRLLTPSVPLKTDSQYDQRKQRIRFRKRAGLEATISHLKQHFRM